MKINILIVEDHELTRFGLKTTFEGVDYVENIYEADSAEKALEIFNEHPVDVVVRRSYPGPLRNPVDRKDGYGFDGGRGTP